MDATANSDLLRKGEREKTAFEQKIVSREGRENEGKERRILWKKYKGAVLDQSGPGI